VREREETEDSFDKNSVEFLGRSFRRREGKRERECAREGGRDTRTHRQRKGAREREIQVHAGKERDRERKTHIHTDTERARERQIHIHTDKERERKRRPRNLWTAAGQYGSPGL